MEILLTALDKIGHGLSRVTGGRFQWPCWMLGWAWDYRARKDCPAEPTPR